MSRPQKFGAFVAKRQLACFVALALVVSVAMTGVSMWIYAASGAIKLDLSRPGYEKVRQEVTANDDSQQPYPSSGALTPEALKDFRERLDKSQADLNGAGNFNGDTLTDKNLGLE